MKKQIIILGAGGHAKVLASALDLNGENILGFLAPDTPVGQKVFLQASVLGGDDYISSVSDENLFIVNGIGHMPSSSLRKEIFVKYQDLNYLFANVNHPTAYIAEECTICEGAQLMAGSILQPGANIGKNVIINTGSKIDHDTIIGDHSHIAPGATICGDVSIGKNCFIGAGATIIQGVDVGDNVVIGAGLTVLKNISAECVYTG